GGRDRYRGDEQPERHHDERTEERSTRRLERPPEFEAREADEQVDHDRDHERCEYRRAPVVVVPERQIDAPYRSRPRHPPFERVEEPQEGMALPGDEKQIAVEREHDG